MEERYPVGKDAKGEVVQLLDRGVVVRLDDYIEGFVPQSQLGWEDLEDPADVIHRGDELPLRVIELEPSSRRIVLSVRSYFNGRPMEELSAFRESLEGRERPEPDEPTYATEEAAETAAEPVEEETVETVEEAPEEAAETPAEPVEEETVETVEEAPEEAEETPAETKEEESVEAVEEAPEADEEEDKK
jgi:small subunit ribosomal protein S1